jgi:hypothetical protein
MTIIYVPFDVDMFWLVLELGTVFGVVGFILEMARMHGGINPRNGRYP